MKKNVVNILVIILIIFLFTVNLTAADTGQNGSIDWEKSKIVVTGFGAPPEDKSGGQAKLLAQRAAKVDAYRNAVEFIRGIRVSSTTTVEDYVVQSDRIKTQVDGLVKNGQFINIEYGADGICKATLELPLTGQGSLTSFFEQRVKEDLASNQSETGEESQKDEESEAKQGKREINKDVEEYTGLVIDTRGLDVVPALYPQIFDLSGRLLYGPTLVSSKNPDKLSLVAYSRSEKKAMEMKRLGRKPLLIKAVSFIDREGDRPTDIVLNSDNTAIFKLINQNKKIVEKRAIVFIID